MPTATTLTRARVSPAPLPSLEDADLVRRARDGDERAFEEIVRRYRAPAHPLQRAPRRARQRRGRDPARAGRAAAHLRDDPRPIHLRAWLYRVAHNAAINMRARKDFSHEELSPEIDGVPQPPELAAQRSEVRQVVSDLDRLPERQRTALLLSVFEGLGYDEIAARLDTSPNSVRALLSRARVPPAQGRHSDRAAAAARSRWSGRCRRSPAAPAAARGRSSPAAPSSRRSWSRRGDHGRGRGRHRRAGRFRQRAERGLWCPGVSHRQPRRFRAGAVPLDVEHMLPHVPHRTPRGPQCRPAASAARAAAAGQAGPSRRDASSRAGPPRRRSRKRRPVDEPAGREPGARGAQGENVEETFENHPPPPTATTPRPDGDTPPEGTRHAVGRLRTALARRRPERPGRANSLRAYRRTRRLLEEVGLPTTRQGTGGGRARSRGLAPQGGASRPARPLDRPCGARRLRIGLSRCRPRAREVSPCRDSAFPSC